MSEIVQFFCPGIPRSQGSKTLGRTKEGRSYMREASGSVHRWRKAVSTAALVAFRPRLQPHGGPVAVPLCFTSPPPKSSNHPPYPTKRNGDLDKLTRAVLDALTGIVLVDDSAVQWITASKCWGEAPGVHVHVTRAQQDDTDRASGPAVRVTLEEA